MARTPVSASGNARLASSAGCTCLQLRRARIERSDLRHLAQPALFWRRGVRVLGRRFDRSRPHDVRARRHAATHGISSRRSRDGCGGERVVSTLLELPAVAAYAISCLVLIAMFYVL